MFITDRGTPAHVLLTIEEYQRLVGREVTIADLLGMPGAEDIELPVMKRTISVRVPELE